MYPVSYEFQDKIMDMKNRKVFCRVEIDYTDVFLDESIVVTANENANISYPQQTADNVKIPVGKILSLDGSCSFDGTYTFAPIDIETQTKQLGWWGSQLSDSNGNFNLPYPTLSIEFTSRPITKLNVFGDSFRKEYPVNFKIYLYNNSDILLYEEEIVNNNKIEWTKNLDAPITNASKILLEITKWSHSGRQVKILEFYTSIREVYEGEDVINLKVIEQREVSGLGVPIGTVASNEISLKLNNISKKFDAGNTQSPLYEVLKPNRRIKAYLGIEKNDGIKEYVPLGVFWSGDWSVPEHMAYASTDGRDRLKFLEETLYYTESPILNMSLYELALDVLQDAGLSSNEYYVDVALSDYIIPVVSFNGTPHREVLRLIAEVCLGQVYCNRLGVIRVEANVPVSQVRNVSVNQNANVSYPNQIVDGIEVPSDNYIILDGLSSFDGTFAFAPLTESDGQLGWMGSSISDVNGNFTSPYPICTISFEPKTLGMVNITGDSIKGEYPVDYNITIKDIDNNVLAYKIITGNTDVISSVPIPENPTNASSASIEILKWSHANTIPKILEFIDSPYQQKITVDQYFKKNNPLKYSNLVNNINVIVYELDDTGKVVNESNVVVKDSVSIIQNGFKSLEISDNQLIQSIDLATNIANNVLKEYANVRRDLELEWRGNPSVLLGDDVIVTDDMESNVYKVVQQEITFAGALRASINGRRLLI